MKDLYTGEEFIPTRKSQKFATPQNRIAYYNAIAAEVRKKKSSIDKPIHVNYKILEHEMMGLNESTFHQEFLRGRGFNFEVYNHTEIYDGMNRPSIYQYIIIHLENNYTKVVRNDRYPQPYNH